MEHNERKVVKGAAMPTHPKGSASRSEELADAIESLHGGRYGEAYGSLLGLAREGSADAWLNLGWMHHTGTGVDKDLDRAREYYRHASDSGSLIARHYLGTLCRAEGHLSDALNWFELAANDNYLPSLYWAGSMYLLGEGVPPDAKKAEDYLRAAAKQGHIFARRDIALALIKGTFGRRSIAKGVSEWIVAIVTGIRVAICERQSDRLM